MGRAGAAMKPHTRDDFHNGDEGSGSDSEAGSETDSELWVEDREAPARALAALNALRKSRQHYDVVLLAGGAEVPAHRALLAAASPYLLQALAAPASPAAPAAPDAPAAPPAAPAIRVEGVDADALRDLVDYMYTGRLSARDAAAARRLYCGAWRLRLEAARAALAERLVRRLAPGDCLDTRALPDLPPQYLEQLDAYIADNFDELCTSGALAALPLVRIEMLRASSADGGEEAPTAVAEAALAWLRDHDVPDTLEELCSRTHLVFVDGRGALRDCGELPAARGDAPELQEYRRAAHLRAERPGRRAPPPRPLAGLELGARRPRPHCAVLAARGAGAGPAPQAACRVTRALLALHGRLVAARVAWRDVGDAAGVAVGGPLGGARDAEGARRASLAVGRCAHGSAVLGARLVVCGGYDRARVLRAAEAYDPEANEWRPLPDLRTARARFPAARLGDALYVCGGSDGHNELDSVDVYTEAAAAWAPRARLPVAASHAAAAGDDEHDVLYVVGGWAGGRSLRSVHKYDPATDAWSEAPSLISGRSQCAAVVWEGALWALGGCDAWHCVASTERLPLAPGAQWAAGVALPTARRSVGGCVWRARLVSAGGSDGAASLRRVDWLAPRAAAWRALPPLRRARAALGLLALHDVLYAVGGFDGKEFLSCVECLYSPEGEWTTLCAPPPPRPPLPGAGAAAALPEDADDPSEDSQRLENGAAASAGRE
ncbi:influenza virus NS1A-binding protein homolog B-like [Pectinophora gossypiella]|nr:influenza virus NS1A-binding protein homolog B-like [Pectinophora gossypiella]